MDSKTIALALLVIFAILLAVIVGFKIKSDKRRKPIIINTTRIKYIPTIWESSPFLSLYVLLLGFIIVFIIPEDWVSIETEANEALFYIVWGAVNSISCFFIVRQNPKSIWYVSIIINAILTAFVFSTQHFWNSPILVSLCGTWLLSIIASMTGARLGRRKAISDKN
jgi:hypothetical protein